MFKPQKSLIAADFHNKPPGSCAWTWDKIDDIDEVCAALVVRLPDGIVPPANTDIDLRMRSLMIDNVAVIILLFRVAFCSLLFRMPVNLFSELYASPLHSWRAAKELRLVYYGDSEHRLGWHQWPCNGEAIFGAAVDAASALPMWTESDFSSAISRVQLTPQQLWDYSQ